MPQTYYKVNLPAASYRECRRLAKNPLEFLIAAMLKTFRIPLPATVGIGFPEVEVLRIAREALSPVLRSLLDPAIETAGQLGLQPSIFYTIPVLGAIEGAVCLMLSASGDYVVALTAGHAVNGAIIEKKLRVSVSSRMRDGRLLVTSASKPEFDPAPQLDIERLVGRPLSEIVARHRERLSFETDSWVPLRSEDDLEQLALDVELATKESLVQRGVFVPLSRDEVARLRAITIPEKPPAQVALTSRNWIEWLCGFCVIFGAFGLGRAGNQAQHYFRWGLIAFGALGWIVAKLYRRQKNKADTTTR